MARANASLQVHVPTPQLVEKEKKTRENKKEGRIEKRSQVHRSRPMLEPRELSEESKVKWRL